MQVITGTLAAVGAVSDPVPWCNPHGLVPSVELSGEFVGRVVVESAEVARRVTASTEHPLVPVVYEDVEPAWEQLHVVGGPLMVATAPGVMTLPQQSDRRLAVRIRAAELLSGAVEYRLQSPD